MALSMADLGGCAVVAAAGGPRPLAEFAPSRGRRPRPSALDAGCATGARESGAVPLKRLRPCGLTSFTVDEDVASEGGSLGDTASTGNPSRPSSIQRDASFARSLASSSALPRASAGMRSPSRASSFSGSLNFDECDGMDGAAAVSVSVGGGPAEAAYKYCLTV